VKSVGLTPFVFKTNGKQPKQIACTQGIVFFLIIRPDQEKAIKKILSVLRALAVQDAIRSEGNNVPHYKPKPQRHSK